MDNSLSWLVEFLQIVCSGDLTSDPEQFSMAISILNQNYSPEIRHKYSRIAVLLRSAPFNNYFPDEFDTARENFRIIASHYDDNETSNEQRKWIEKLFDYLELEFDRITNVEKRLQALQDNISNLGQAVNAVQKGDKNTLQLLKHAMSALSASQSAVNASKQALEKAEIFESRLQTAEDTENTLRTQLKESQKQVENISEEVKNFNNQSVTILSIFTAVVFAFTGGFTMLGSAFSNLANISRNESLLLIILVLIVGLILADIIYFLICFIGRLSNVYIGVSCSHDCENCKQKKENAFTCSIWKRLRYKHCAMKCINILIVIIVAFLLIFNLSKLTPLYPGQKLTDNKTVIAIQQSPVEPTNAVTAAPLPTEKMDSIEPEQDLAESTNTVAPTPQATIEPTSKSSPQGSY